MQISAEAEGWIRPTGLSFSGREWFALGPASITAPSSAIASRSWRSAPTGSPTRGHAARRTGTGSRTRTAAPAGDPDALYWSMSSLTIPLGALVMFFKVTIPRPGEYEVVLKLQSPDFYDKGDQIYRDKLIARPLSEP